MEESSKKIEEEVIIGEKGNLKTIVIQFNEDDLSTTILSSLSPDENIDYLIEAAGVNAKELIDQGRDREEVIEDLRDFMEQVIEEYLEDPDTD